MITAVANRSVLVKRELRDGKMVDVKTIKKGTPIGKAGNKVVFSDGKINLSEEDAVRIWGALDLTDAQKKTLNVQAKTNGWKRVI